MFPHSHLFLPFIANYISTTTTQPCNVYSPIPSRTASTGSISWTSAPSKLPRIASGFFQQVTRMNWLDDKNIFNWGRSEDSDVADDVFFFLEKFYGRSRSGSVSESDSKPSSRNRSRTNSFTNMSMEGYKVEGMTSLPVEEQVAHDVKPVIARNVTSRRMFRIDDVEEEDEEELGQLAVAEVGYQGKKDV